MGNRDSDTFVGELFTVEIPTWDKDPLVFFQGYQCKLLGFKEKLEFVFPHQSDRRKPGIYATIGDPVVRLETDQIVQIPLENLRPVQTDFVALRYHTDNYRAEASKYRYVAELPHMKGNVGDKILVAKHGLLKDDLLGRVDDIVPKGRGIVYLVDSGGPEHVQVRDDQIIDVIELGDYSEYLRAQHRAGQLEAILQRKGLDFKYSDHESRIKGGW